jgi:hypothetical protein
MMADGYKQEVRVSAVLAATSAETRRVARMWLYYTLFYWLFPTLAVLFTYVLAKQPVKFLDLLIHGEFLIYSITIVAGSTRLIAKDIPSRGPFVSRQGFNLVSHIMIFPAIVAFVLLRYISTVSANPTINTTLVVIYSIALLIAAFRFSYVVFLIDAQRSTPDEIPKRAAAAIAQAPDKLKAEFGSIQEHDPHVPRAVPESIDIERQEAEELEEAAAAEEEEEEGVLLSKLSAPEEAPAQTKPAAEEKKRGEGE